MEQRLKRRDSRVPLSSQNFFQDFLVIGESTWEKCGYSILAETRSPCFNFLPIPIFFPYGYIFILLEEECNSRPIDVDLAMPLALINRMLVEVV